MKKINVDLYGGKGIFGGKETPLEADIIYCDTADKCSLYKEGKCLNCRSWGGIKCKKGIVQTITGYTSRAKKYMDFKNTYKNDETYAKLQHPNNIYVALIDDTLYLNFVYVSEFIPKNNISFYVNEWGYAIEDGYLNHNVLIININEMNIDFLARILSYKPSALMGGEIKDYQEKIVPNLVNDLKKVVPKLYNDLIEKYPQFNKDPNYIGRYAYMKTLVNGITIIDCHGNKGVKNGDMIYCKEFKRGFVPFDGESAECTIKIKDNEKYKITDNSQWDENTIFD